MILNKFEAKLSIPLGVTMPEVYVALAGTRPPNNFIISRDRSSNVLSRYGDIFWDISAWHIEGRLNVLYFDFWGAEKLTAARDQLTQDSRWLIFSLIWLRDGEPFGIGVLTKSLSIVRALALYADDVSCSLLELFSDEKRLRTFSQTRCTDSMIIKLSSLLSNLSRIGGEQLGFYVVCTGLRKELKKIIAEYIAGLKQHTPIPTRIYSAILNSLELELTEWERVAPEALELLQSSGKDPFYGKQLRSQQEINRRTGLAWTPRPEWGSVASPNIRAYLRDKGQSDNITGLMKMVAEIQEITKLSIQGYSGMRDEESSLLQYHCSSTTVSGGRTHRLIQGRTTKLARDKRTRWVTNREGHRAIAIAQKIAAMVYSVCDASWVMEENAKTRASEPPLFVSLAYLENSDGSRKRPSDAHFFAACLKLTAFSRLRARLEPTIEESDLVELEQIDVHRAWRSESKFKVGSRWVLMTHQLRRSLAMYAHRSGLVTIQSLRKQLQHITDEMARYYARGSQYAKEIFGDDIPESDHFCLDWQLAQGESEGISHAINVLSTDDPLFGGHAAFAKYQLLDADGVISIEKRTETMRMFKKGQLHYKETLIGGCTLSGECDRPAVDWLNIDCIRNNCANMVGNLKKLENVITQQELFVQTISPTSLMYRTENTNLAVLVSARDKARLDAKKGLK